LLAVSEEELELEAESSPGARRLKRRPRQEISLDQEETHFRGLPKPISSGSKILHFRLNFGSGHSDLLPMIHTRDNWAGAMDSTFPSKKTLKRVQGTNSYGTGATFGVEKELLDIESSTGWDWYYNDNRDPRLRDRQKLRPLVREAAQKYLPLDDVAEHTVLLGPSGDQKSYRLRQSESLDFGDAWIEHQARSQEAVGESSGVGGGDAQPTNSESPTPSRIREGWIVNLGNDIQDLCWAPNCSGTQYLAVTVPITDQQKQAFPDMNFQKSPAFNSSPPYPTAIQIWSFESKESEGGLRSLDMTKEPRLRILLCTDSGDIKQLRWCPMTRDKRPSDETDEDVNIGLLAGIWGDGTVNVLDIMLRKDVDDTEISMELPRGNPLGAGD
jgi:transcription factor C subunit 6